jgi:hypothetical protein
MLYGYSATRFISIKLPRVLEKALFTGVDHALHPSLNKSPRRTRARSHKQRATQRK